MIFPLISVFLLVLADQAAKFYASLYLKDIPYITVIPHIFQLTYVENRGAAFGILQGQLWLFVIVTVLLTCGIIYYYRTLPNNSLPSKISLILILGGAMGNFIDRVKNGFVVDFLEFIFIRFPVFNMADMYVVTGSFLLAAILLLPAKEENKWKI